MKKGFWLYGFLLMGIAAPGQNKKVDSLYALVNRYAKEDQRKAELLNELSFRIFKSEPEKSLQYAQKALSLSQDLLFPRGELMAKNNLAVYNLMKGNSELALELTFDAVRIGEREQMNDLIADSYSILGTIYHNQSQYDKATEFLNQALRLTGLKNNVVTNSRIFNSLGGIARDKKKYDSALMHYAKALSIMDKGHDNYRIAEVLNNIGIVHLRQQKVDLSLKYFTESLQAAKETGNRRGEILSLINIGNVLIEKKKYDQAEKIELECLRLSQEIGDVKKIQQIYLSLATIKMETGKYHDAHLLMTKHYNLKDSLQNLEKQRQLAEIETRYETEKKDQTILALQKQKEIQNLKQLYLFILLLTVIAAFTVIYILQKKYNKRVSALLETQKSLNLQLHDTDELKSRFFANISHEFRTPLSLILAPIEAKLKSNTLPKADNDSFQLVRRNGYRLLSLVNQLLDLSKLEVGKMKLHMQRGNLKQLLALIAASFDSLAENKKIYFAKNIVLTFEETWYDADKLEKIINNLLSNAFKFTPAGGTVLLDIQSSPDENELKIIISDTGKGIPEEERPFVFSPFYQSKYNRDDGQPGTGLGLSLVHELVKLYGGSVSLESVVNLGTKISVTLPLLIQSSESEVSDDDSRTNIALPAQSSSSIHDAGGELAEHMDEDDKENEMAHGESVLIIEDNVDLRNFISSILSDNYTAITAKNGEEGFMLAAEQMPDLIISDVMMPKLNGIELTQKIKSDERTSHIPIVLLTAKADLSSRLEGFKFGADDYLAKPFSTEELLIRVTNLIEQRKKLARKYRAGLSEPSPLPRIASLDEKFLQRAKQIVETHMSNSAFGVEKMAEEILLSRAQMFRKLKAISGLSPNEFINDIRLQKAADLIRAKADTLTQISYSVGYSEQSYFAKRFRKKFGVTPSEYNKNPVKQEA
jgi:signal transduction histidine kinase/DNA-binding response OmpR family regulator/Tfp pilus assembly protein PilF